MLVPVPVQQQIAEKAPLLAYAPSRLAPGWHYERWTHAGSLRIYFANRAGREIVFVAAPFKGDCRAGKEAFFQMAGVKTYWNHTATSDRKSTRLNSSHLGISYAVF